MSIKHQILHLINKEMYVSQYGEFLGGSWESEPGLTVALVLRLFYFSSTLTGIQIGFNVEYHSIVDEQIGSALAWSLLLSKTIIVMTVVKMLWAHEAQPTANKQSDCDITAYCGKISLPLKAIKRTGSGNAFAARLVQFLKSRGF